MLCSNLTDVHASNCDFLTNEEILNIDVLCTAMKLRILSQFNSCAVIPIKNRHLLCVLVLVNRRFSQITSFVVSIAAAISDSVVEVMTIA